MKIVQICEPLFQYICRLNRIGERGILDFRIVRGEVEDLLQNAETKASQDVGTQQVFDKIKLPLIFFVDSMIVESGISCATEWDSNRLAYEHEVYAGDEAFFAEYLDRVIDGSDPNKADLYSFYYVCLGLGFQGVYFTQPEELQKYIRLMEPKLRSFLDSDLLRKIAPDTYKHTNRSNLITPPAPKVTGIAIAFVGVTIAVFAGVVIMYNSASRDLAHSITTIDQKPIGEQSQ